MVVLDVAEVEAGEVQLQLLLPTAVELLRMFAAAAGFAGAAVLVLSVLVVVVAGVVEPLHPTHLYRSHSSRPVRLHQHPLAQPLSHQQNSQKLSV